MAKDKLAPGFQRFEFRSGIGGFPGWDGLDLRTDAAAVPANKFTKAQNVRYWGGDVIARGGQAKLNSVVTGGLLGIFDTSEDEGSQKLWGFPYGDAAGLVIIWW
jgi:hypothetical protein